ncbi:hypothetical protein BKA64DRAFT_714103 [Cadophora sp. MPI-SDFR-AT-0126]|nr:hypothetical protein BKA64DRAFT_714103 [Leotiomycetes sp. MPI-SDFR-AT-0126]
MKLFIPFAMLLAATVSANPIATQQEASEAAELDKRDNVSVTICKNINYTGDCTTIKVGSGTCYTLGRHGLSSYNDQISSFHVLDGGCIFYNDDGCTGTSYGSILSLKTQDSDLTDGNGKENDVISSFYCLS